VSDVGEATAVRSSVPFRVFDLVWARVRNYPKWPSQVVDPAKCTEERVLKAGKQGQLLIRYFGDHTYGWYDKESKDLEHFDARAPYLCAKESELFRKALIEANAEKSASVSSMKQAQPLRNIKRHRPRAERKGGSSSLRSMASADDVQHESKLRAQEAPAAPVEDHIFTVREVLGLKVKTVAGKPCLVFKIWWLGYPKSTATEEPAENLSPHLVDIWRRGHPDEWNAAMRKAAHLEIKRIRRLNERNGD